MALTDHLRSLPDGDLVELFQHRPDLATAADHGFGALARRAGSAHSLGRLLVRSDVGMLVAAEAVCAAPGASVGDLAELVGTDDVDAMVDALDRLRRRGAVMVEQGGVHPAGQLLELFPYPFGLGRSVRRLAAGATVAELETLLQRLDGDAATGSHTELLGQLATLFSDEDRVRAVLDSLPADAVALASRLVERRMPLVDLPIRAQRDPSDPRVALIGAGMLHPIGHERAELAREVSFALVEGGLAPTTPFRPPPALRHDGPDRARVDAGAATAAARLLTSAEQLIDDLTTRPASLRRDRTLGVRELKRLSKLVGLEAHDTARLVELVVVAELAALDEAAVVVTEAGSAWLDDARHERWLHLVHAWLDTDRLLSLSGAPDADGRQRPALAHQSEPIDVRSARLDLLRVVAGTPDEVAFDRPSLWTLATWFAPNRWGGRALPVEETVEWMVREAELLGLVADDAPSSAARPAADGDDLALEDVGRRFLPADESRIVLQSDLTAVAFGALEPRAASTLAEMADRERADGATRYRFSAASVRRALDVGWRPEDLLAFLTDRAVSGVPQPLEYLINDVARRHGHLTVHEVGAVIVGDDPVLVTDVANHRRTRSLQLRLVAPTVLVSPLPADRVLAGLRDAGYLPVGDGDLVRLAVPDDASGAERSAPRRLALPRLDPGLGPAEADELVGLLRDIDAEGADGTADAPAGEQAEVIERARTLRGRQVEVRWFDGDEIVTTAGLVALVVPDGLVVVGGAGDDGVVTHVGLDDLLEIEERSA
ncbi:MAG: helicase-associated domain-containing protein [Actinomycetota bacterium]